MKKIVLRTALFEFILAVVFAVFVAFGASARIIGGDCGASGSNMQWSLDTETGELTITGTGAMKDCTSPTGVPWYYYSSSICSVTIGSNVASISDYAFYGCTSLTSVAIPDSVIIIGNCAFFECTDLTSLALLNGVTRIGSNAFSGCSSLTSITIPDSVTYIGNYAFNRCINLESITVDEGNSVYHSSGDCLIEASSKTLITGCKNSIIPADGSVTSIGYSAFEDCTSLTAVTIPAGVTCIGSNAFSGCSSLTSITIPNSVISIGDGAFDDCTDLTSITLPSNVTSINHHTFTDCASLMSVTIPAGVTRIGSYAFSGCSSLTSITIPNSVTEIDLYAFSGCDGLTSITIPFVGAAVKGGTYNTHFGYIFGASYDSVNNEHVPSSLKTVVITGGDSIGNRAFYGCSGLTSITILDGVTSIGNSAFYNCSGLTSVTIPDGVTSIGGSAFYTCRGLTSIKIPKSVTSIGNSAFRGCSNLTSITIPDAVTSIDEYVFSGCGLTSVMISDSVTSIGAYAFSCTGLTSVTIPDSVTSIGDYAFSNCINLMSVAFYPDVWNIGKHAFYECYKLIEVCNCSSLCIVPGSTANGFIAYYARNVYTPTSGERKLTYTKDGCVFYQDEDAAYLMGYIGDQTELTVSDMGAEFSVYKFAFYKRTDLTSIILPDNVTSIDDYAFYRCTGLTMIALPDDLKSICEYAFSGCICLESITIPSAVTSVDCAAFYGCSGLRSITVPFVGGYKSRTNCTNFGYIFGALSYSENNKYVPSSLKTVVINSDADIDDFAFYGCDGLTSIIFEYAANVIDDSAYVIYSGTTIYGYKNSSAEAYADKYGRKFVEIVCEHAASEDWVIDEEPSCAEDGKKHINCKKCRAILEEAAIPAIGHDYVEPIYTWNGDQCIAERVCTHDANHVETETVTAVYVKDTDATCTVNEYGHYEAKFTNAAFVKQATAANSIEKSNSKLGHSFTKYVSDGNATCIEDGTKTAICDHGCGETDTIADTGSKLGHSYGEWTQIKAPTCVDKGEEQRNCTRCDHYETRDISATGIHTPSSPVRENEIDATAITDGGYDEVVYCSVCHAEISRTHCVTPATGIEQKRGDMNGDDTLNTADAVYLLRSLMRPDRYPISQGADVNGDGAINTADAVYLLRHLMRPSKYPLADDNDGKE